MSQKAPIDPAKQIALVNAYQMGSDVEPGSSAKKFARSLASGFSRSFNSKNSP
jgi:hypothetical protein